MEQTLNLALLQADLVWEDKEANLANFSSQIALLPKSVDVIILPEMFTTGFSMNADHLAEPNNGPTLSWMQKMAKECSSCITGSVIVREDGHFFNRLYWVFPDGSFKHYDKRHLFRFGEEDTVYSAGMSKLVVEWKGWRICPMICYDLRFPVWIRNLDAEPYDLLVLVANWPSARTHVWDTLLKARAMENVCFVAGVNRIGKDGRDLVYDGHSQVLDPKGFQLNDELIDKQAVLVTLEKSWLTDFRKKFNTLLDGDKFQIIL